MRLAKSTFDIGLVTDNIVAVEDYWHEKVGLSLNHKLRLGPSHVQHRYDLAGSVLKLNSREVDKGQPGGYYSLIIARDNVQTSGVFFDPDNNRYEISPRGDASVAQIGVRVRVKNAARHRRFYTQALRLPQVGENSFQIGSGLIILEEDKEVVTDTPLWGRGWRYLTLQIFDVIAAHERILGEGGRESMPVMQLSNISRASVILDPDGNAIELSQRADLAGPLDDRMAGSQDPMGDVERSRAKHTGG